MLGISSSNSSNRVIWEVAGNCNDNSVVRMTRFMSIFLLIVGVSRDVIHKDKERMTKYRQTWIGWKEDIAPIPTSTICGKDRCIQCFQRSIETHNQRNVQHWVNTNLAKQSEQLCVLRAYGILKKGQFTACVVNVWCLRLNKQKVKNGIDIISNPPYVIKEVHIGERHGPEQWRYDHRKTGDATEGSKKNTMSPLNKYGSPIIHTKNRNCRTIGLLSTASTSTNSKTVNMDYYCYLEWKRSIPEHVRRSVQRRKDHGKMSIWDDFKLVARSFADQSRQKIFLHSSRWTISTATIGCTTWSTPGMKDLINKYLVRRRHVLHLR